MTVGNCRKRSPPSARCCALNRPRNEPKRSHLRRHDAHPAQDEIPRRIPATSVSADGRRFWNPSLRPFRWSGEGAHWCTAPGTQVNAADSANWNRPDPAGAHRRPAFRGAGLDIGSGVSGGKSGTLCRRVKIKLVDTTSEVWLAWDGPCRVRFVLRSRPGLLACGHASACVVAVDFDHVVHAGR